MVEEPMEAAVMVEEDMEAADMEVEEVISAAMVPVDMVVLMGEVALLVANLVEILVVAVVTIMAHQEVAVVAITEDPVEVEVGDGPEAVAVRFCPLSPPPLKHPD